MRHVGVRRATLAVAAGLLALSATGCGSLSSIDAGDPGQNSSQVPGTRPSQSIPPGFQDVTGSASASTTTPGTDPTPSTSDLVQLQVTDNVSGDYVAAAEDSAGGITVVEVGLHGVGLIWPTGESRLRRTTNGTELSYFGPGRVGHRAPLGLPFAAGQTEHSRPAHLRIVAAVDADGLGHASVWVGSRHYRVTSIAPPHTADPVVEQVISDFHDQDWNDLYDLLITAPGMSRAEFARSARSQGPVAIHETGSTTYVNDQGTWHSETPVRVHGVLSAHPLDRAGVLHLLYRAGTWKFSGIVSPTH